MRKTDLFPENDSPGCELREPERPIDAPYAVDIPAVPTALGALDAASRAEFWGGAGPFAYRRARSQKPQTPSGCVRLGIRGRAARQRLARSGLAGRSDPRIPLGKMARARPERMGRNTETRRNRPALDRQLLPSAAQGLAGCADTPLLPRGHEPARQSLREHRRNPDMQQGRHPRGASHSQRPRGLGHHRGFRPRHRH